ncbi:MAG: SRPBCC domain-containing protein [Terracidiphilus sp.]
MAHGFTVSATIPASPKAVYDAWLSSEGHAAMTGAGAKVSARVGGAFTAWDGYISGKNLKLKPGKQIVQSWRTTEFAASDPDSQIEVLLEKARGGTKLTLHHTNIPGGQSDYKSGWRDCYFEPVKKYFKANAKPA